MRFIVQMKRKLEDNWILVLLGILVFDVLLYCFSQGIEGNDFWWHVKAGEWIVQNKQVPKTDIFSWYGQEKQLAWVAHEWLAEVCFYFLFSWGGEMGIYIFALGMAMILLILVFLIIHKKIKKNMLIAGIYMVLFAVVCSFFFYGRPHIFSYFLLLAELKCLYDFYENVESKKIYWIPVIACLWSNLHGGSSGLSYVLCVLLMISGMFKLECVRIVTVRFNKTQIMKLTIVTFASIVALLCNPLGVDVLVYPYKNLSDMISMKYINEWQVPDAKQWGAIVLYFLPIVLVSVGIITEQVKVRLWDLVVMLLFLFLFMRSARFIILWYIAAAFYAPNYFPKCRLKPISMLYEKVLLMFVIFGLVISGIIMGVQIRVNLSSDDIIKKNLSQSAINMIKGEKSKRVFNDYNISDIMIFNDIPVFFDSRADLFSECGALEDGFELLSLSPNMIKYKGTGMYVEEMIEKYGFEAFLIEKQRPLYFYLVSHPERFGLRYEQENVAYFQVLNIN